MKMQLKAAALVLLCGTLVFAACSSDSSDHAPRVTTLEATQITSSSAVSGGVITDGGDAEITAKGVCWSTTTIYPTIDDNRVAAGSGTGDFSATISGLSPGIKYFGRAYATNSAGTGYGNIIMFTTDKLALVFIDSTHLDDNVTDALEAQGYQATVAATAGAFITGLTSGGYTLVVLFAQNLSAVTNHGISASDIQAYIDGGGLMVFATWTSADAAIATVFEASLSGTTNLSTVTISDADLQSVAGLSSFTLANTSPPWTTYSCGLTAIGDGEVLATFENANAAMVLGNNGQTMMLGYLSDTVPSANSQAIFESVVAKLSASQN